jgi:peptidoglycan/xylan/chitin deacetylase (PgdA/CDA1 family)
MTEAAPTLAWPDGHTSAFSLTIDLHAEWFWIDRYPEAMRLPKTLSIGRYGVLRGVPRLLEVLAETGTRATWFVPAAVAFRYRSVVADLSAEGHEVALLLSGIDTDTAASPAAQGSTVEEIKKALDTVAEATGSRPAGLRIAGTRITDAWVPLLAGAGLTWTSTIPAGNAPTQWTDASSSASMLELPYNWELTDYTYLAFNMPPATYPPSRARIAPYESVLRNWEDVLIANRELGNLVVPRFEASVIGKPGRIAMLEELLELARSAESSWTATLPEIATWATETQQADRWLDQSRHQWAVSTTHHS